MVTFQVDLTLSDSDDEVPLKSKQAAPAAAVKTTTINVTTQQQQTASVTVAPVQVAAPITKTNGRFNLRNKTREKQINYNE